jgi:phage gp29-like protein
VLVMAKSKILGPDGQPLMAPTVDEIQTENNPQVGMIMQQFSEHPSVGITPNRAARLLQDAERGDLVAQCQLAEDMEEKDTHLFSELGKRRRAWLPVPWTLQPPHDASAAEKADCELIEQLLRSFDWLPDTIFDASDALLKGYSAQEYTGWENVDGLLMPKGCEWRDPSIFQVLPTDPQTLRLRDGSYEGVALNPLGWMVHRAKSKSGYMARTGLVRTLVWPFIWKNYSVRDLAEFLEIYGLPLKLGKFPEGATEKDKAALMRAVLSIGHNAGGIIPRGMDIDFQTATSGQADPFELMISWGERSMSKAILGGTLTSQADGKSSTNALGNVHNEMRQELRDSDLMQLAHTLNRDLVFPLYALNAKSYRTARRVPKLVFDTTEAEDMATFAKSVPALVGVGMQIPLAWAHEKLKIPMPAKDEPVLAKPAPAPPQADPLDPATLSARLPVAALSATTNTTELDEGQAQLDAVMAAISGESWGKVMAPILQPVISAIIKDGPEAAMAQAATLYPQMDTDALAELLTRAIFLADTWGRISADNDV